jgi:hypothetical protein
MPISHPTNHDSLPETVPRNLWQWFVRHLPALLYGWFWFGMVLCGLLAPKGRVQELESSLVTEGWHLSLMAGVFGAAILSIYYWRMSRSDT